MEQAIRDKKRTFRKVGGAAVAVAVMIVIAVVVALLVHNSGAGAAVTVENGLSAYELAAQYGYEGTMQDWLDSLNGKSAYEIAVENGYTGTQEDWEARISSLAESQAQSIQTASFNSKGELVLTLADGTQLNLGKAIGADGKDGTNGKNGADGKDGTDGKNGEDGISITDVDVNQAGELVLTFSDNKTVNLGKVVGAAGAQGIQGEKGDTGAQGEQGVGIQNIQIADRTMTVTLTNGREFVFENVVDADGEDGISPQIRINAASNEWEISTDEGTTWTSTGVKATGEKGETGAQGIQGEKGEKGDQGEQGVQGIQGEKGEQGEQGIQGIQGEKGDKGDTGAAGAAGQDGITPQTRINASTNLWEISTDNGVTWTSTDVPATGEKGEQGEQGIQGEKGETGAAGKDGNGITGITVNEDNYLVITMKEGDPIVIEQSIVGEKGEQGEAGAQGVGIKSVRLTADYMLVISLTDNTELSPIGPIRGAQGEQGIQGEKGETGAQGVQGEAGENGLTPILSMDAEGNLYVKYGEEGAASLLANIKGPKGDTGAAGAQGEKGEKGDTGAQGEKGDPGVDGKSAYELYKEAYPDYTGTMEEWLASLKGADGADGVGIADIVTTNLNGATSVTVKLTNGNEETFTIETGSDSTMDALSDIQGLVYTELADGTLSVSMHPDVTCGNVISIPKYYKGKLVTEIADNGFDVNYAGTDDLKLISLPDSITRIGNMAFYDTSLQEIIIPSSVKVLGKGIFIYTPTIYPSSGGMVFEDTQSYWRSGPTWSAGSGTLYEKDENGNYVATDKTVDFAESGGYLFATPENLKTLFYQMMIGADEDTAEWAYLLYSTENSPESATYYYRTRTVDAPWTKVE